MNNILRRIRNWTMGIGFVAAVGYVGQSYFIADSITTRIIDTEVKRSDKNDIYLVFTEAEVFKNTDAWYRGKTKSSNMQGECMRLKGHEVEIEKYGWRIGLLSMYENIVDVKEVVPDSTKKDTLTLDSLAR